MLEKIKYISIAFIALICFWGFVFSAGADRKDHDPASYLHQIDDLDDNLKSEYGIFPEDALSLLECYLLEDESDYYPISQKELEDAYAVISKYYYNVKDISSRGIDDLTTRQD